MPLKFTAMLDPFLAAMLLDKNPSHGFRGRGKKMAATVPSLRRFNIDETNVRLVNEGRRLKGLPWLFLGQFCGGQLAQLVVDQRQEPLGGIWVARLDLRQYLRDVDHPRGILGQERPTHYTSSPKGPADSSPTQPISDLDKRRDTMQSSTG